MAFDSLRTELTRDAPRPERIRDRLEMMARNLQSVQTWAMHAYGLVTGRELSPGLPQEVRLHDLLQEVIVEIQRLFPDFSCILAPALASRTIRLTTLEKRKAVVIFFNILDNSFKYSPPDRKHIEVHLLSDLSSLTISIEDRGFGISGQHLSRLFEPFFSNPRVEWPQSMGLGLSTVRRLIDDLGWTCEVKSVEGRGTCFSVIIPQADPREGYG
jgi:signal transduction histidine kinase